MTGLPLKTDVIDADAHVVESERVWDYLDASEQKYRPTLVASPDNPQRQIWMLDGENIGNKFPSPDEKQSEQHLKQFGREVGTPVEARELSDVKQRLRHMDELGIDVQVMFNSLWITPLTSRPFTHWISITGASSGGLIGLGGFAPLTVIPKSHFIWLVTVTVP